MRRAARLSILAVFGMVLIGRNVTHANDAPFPLQCQLPFPIATEARAIDQMCDLTGHARDDMQAQQNAAKNNLCQGTAVPISIHQQDFVSLQQIAEQRGIPFGHSGFGSNHQERLPQDRTSLASLLMVNDQSMGEGSYVQFVAFMAEPHYSDTHGGESVNCNISGEPPNDIHISLVQSPPPGRDDPDRIPALCQSVVAEVIPHYRPAAWEKEQLQAVADQQIPVRIAGQLFFDASHFPCHGDSPSRGDPYRISLWEIHPVYSIDVCTHGALADCQADDASAWVPIDQWTSTTGP